MSDINKNIVELLTQKRDFMTNILNATKSTSLKGTEKDVDVYTELIENRQIIFNNISDIDKKLQKQEDIISNASGDFLKQINIILEAIQSQAKQIIELDNQNKSLVEKAKTSLTGQIRSVKQGKNLSNIYQSNKDSGYTKFDRMQ